eukprot:COSAG05_NODE_119_length_17779_cov_273.146049_3_plen_820_part_00
MQLVLLLGSLVDRAPGSYSDCGACVRAGLPTRRSDDGTCNCTPGEQNFELDANDVAAYARAAAATTAATTADAGADADEAIAALSSYYDCGACIRAGLPTRRLDDGTCDCMPGGQRFELDADDVAASVLADAIATLASNDDGEGVDGSRKRYEAAMQDLCRADLAITNPHSLSSKQQAITRNDMTALTKQWIAAFDSQDMTSIAALFNPQGQLMDTGDVWKDTAPLVVIRDYFKRLITAAGPSLQVERGQQPSELTSVGKGVVIFSGRYRMLVRRSAHNTETTEWIEPKFTFVCQRGEEDQTGEVEVLALSTGLSFTTEGFLTQEKCSESHHNGPSAHSSASQADQAEATTWRPSEQERIAFTDQLTPFAWTPLWSAPTEGVDIVQLREYILEIYSHDSRAHDQHSNEGFISDEELLVGTLLDTPVLRALKNEIHNHIHAYLRSLALSTEGVGGPGMQSYRIVLGATGYSINTRGTYRSARIDDGAHISGLLYVDDGGDPMACTQFYDARGQRGELASLLDTHVGTLFRSTWRGTNAPISVCPHAGLLVLFPAWLPRAQQALMADGKRISISFSAVLEEPQLHQQRQLDSLWPSAVSNGEEEYYRNINRDNVIGALLRRLGSEAVVPQWGQPVQSLHYHHIGKEKSPLRLHWPTPIRPVVLPELASASKTVRRLLHRLERYDREEQKEAHVGAQAVPRRPRSGWAWHGAAHGGSGVLDHRSSAARELRDAYYKQVYWYVYEMLDHTSDSGSNDTAARIEVEMVDYTAHILRQGDLMLQQARGDAGADLLFLRALRTFTLTSCGAVMCALCTQKFVGSQL